MVSTLVAAGPASAAAIAHGAPKAKNVSVSGVIVARHGRTVAVYARSLAVGKATSSYRYVNVVLPSTRGKTLLTGNAFTASGSARVSGRTLTFQNGAKVSEVAAPAQAWFGVVDSVDASTQALTIDVAFQADGRGLTGSDSARHGDDSDPGDDSGDDGDSGDGADNGHRGKHGDAADQMSARGVAGQAEHKHGRLRVRSMALDVSHASITVDGDAAQASDLESGQFVVVLGSASQDTATAAQVFAFSDLPATLGGTIDSVSGSQVTLDDSTVVDLAPDGSPVPLLLNGNDETTVDQLAAGTHLLAIGTVDDDGVFTADLALAFDSHDDGPPGSNDD